MNILEVQELSKSFGTHQVISELSFAVPEHTVFGFIGKNGAGKTTTMKIILGLLKADSGTIKVCQQEVSYGQTVTNQFIGYLPDVPEYYHFLNSLEYLTLCGEVTGIERKVLKVRSEELLELVGLEDAMKKKIGGFSRGMKQRLGIAQALTNEPKLLICDEPTSALDPLGRKEILDILHKVKEKTTVVFSTHILTDVERICDRIAVLDGGRAVLNGSLADLKEEHGAKVLRVEFGSIKDSERFQSACRERVLLLPQIEGERVLRYKAEDMEELQQSALRILFENRLSPVCIEVEEPSLEALFLEVVK